MHLRLLPGAVEDYDAEEMADAEDDDPDRWLWVDCEGSRSAYQDMVWFIEELDDPNLADQLSRAISGRGAFRRFKDTLFDRPDLISRWHAFSNDRQRGRARSWLACRGLHADTAAAVTGSGGPGPRSLTCSGVRRTPSGSEIGTVSTPMFVIPGLCGDGTGRTEPARHS